MVQVPSYIYLLLDPATLQKVLNAPQYEHDWERKVYWLADNDRMEVRVADDDQLQLSKKPQPPEVQA
jgi:hypothetical protein